MGLDMYLQGHEYRSTYDVNKLTTLDNFPIKEVVVELGYWRKHPNLHGAIIRMFADDKDECQSIELGDEGIRTLIDLVEKNDLPYTEGFFFGTSPSPDIHPDWFEETKQNTIKYLNNALKWINSAQSDQFRWVTYRASW
jgi:hypothetical protein